MKIYQTFILLILIFIYPVKDYSDPIKDTSNPLKAKDCNKANKHSDYTCFIEGKNIKACGDYGPNKYKYIPDIVKLRKKCYKSADESEEYDDF